MPENGSLAKRQKLIARLHSVRVEKYQGELPEIDELSLAASDSETSWIKSRLTVNKFIRDVAEGHRKTMDLGYDRWSKPTREQVAFERSVIEKYGSETEDGLL